MNPDVREYLIHSYLYYKLNTSVISDTEYDMLCKKLLESGIEDPLISREDLAAGTGYSIVEYPKDIIEAAEKLLDSPSKPAAGTDPYASDRSPFAADSIPTYLLLGIYIDYGYARQRDVQDKIRLELQKRWDANQDVSIFIKYFADHRVNLERFGLK